MRFVFGTGCPIAFDVFLPWTALCSPRQAFDPDGKGYIEGATFKNLLMTRGDAFRSEEADAMLAAAMDDESGRIYYEDFAELLANDGARQQNVNAAP